MSKTVYHFNPETGKTGKCSATVKGCAFTVNGETPEHFKTIEEAQSAYEQQMSSKLLANNVSKIQKDDFSELTEENKKEMRDGFHQAKNTFKDLGSGYEEDGNIAEEERIQNEKEDAEFEEKLDLLVQESRKYLSSGQLAYSDYLHQTDDNKETLTKAYSDSQVEYENTYSADYKKDKDREILDRRIQILDNLLLSANESNEENLDFYSDDEVKQYLHDKQITLQQQYSLNEQELISLDEQNQALTKSSNNNTSENRETVSNNLKRLLNLESKVKHIKNDYKLSQDLRNAGFDQDKDLNAYLKEYIHRSRV